MSPKDDFLTIFDFTPRSSYLLHIFENIQKYTFIPNFIKCFEIMVAATLGKNLGPSMPKRGNDSYLPENQEL